MSGFGGFRRAVVDRNEKSNKGILVSWRECIVIALSGGCILAAWLSPPVAQDPAYHDFADSRSLLGIANFWNVASNLPFLAAGVWGLLHSGSCRRDLVPAAMIFSLGLVLICLGSSWYHLQPSNETLVWDRLSMTVSFMAFFSFSLVLVTRSTGVHHILWPLLVAGVASVLYWDLSEAAGQGDLRAYALIQFLPGLLIALFLLLYPRRFPAGKTLWFAIAAYALAKLLEWQDRFIFDELLPLSGHTLKHLAATLGACCVIRAMLTSSGDNNVRREKSGSEA